MDLSNYVTQVRDGVTQAAALADDHTRQVADRLGGAIDASTRLALIHALSDAAGTISAELAPSSVELRMVGQDPEFVVSVHTAESEPTLLTPESDLAGSEQSAEEPFADIDDEPVARISLRLPQSVKVRVDEMAATEGISANAWLTRAVMDALGQREGHPEWPHHPGPPVPPHAPGIFGPHGPFGPHGVFGPGGPFGPGGLFGGRPDKAGGQPTRRGRVQGWVR
jgi:hypothetical protein